MYEDRRHYSWGSKAVFGKANAVLGLQGTLSVEENATSTQKAKAELHPQRKARRLRDGGTFCNSSRACVYKAAEFPGNIVPWEKKISGMKDQVRGHPA